MAEQITAALVVAMTVPPMTAVPAARVFRDPDDAMRSEVMPCMLVEMGDEPSPREVMIGRQDRELEIRVTALATGTASASGQTQADAASLEAYNRVMADRRVGGLALNIIEGPVQRISETSGERLASVTRQFAVEYRTTTDKLDS
jgi:hypothetical protein